MITPENLTTLEATLAEHTITLYTRTTRGVEVDTGTFGHLTGTGLVYSTGVHRTVHRALLDRLIGIEVVEEEMITMALSSLEEGRALATDGPLPGAVVERVQILTPETADPLVTVHLRTGQGTPAKLTGPGRACVAVTPTAQDFITP